MSSSPPLSPGGGSNSYYDAAQLELHYSKDYPLFVKHLIDQGLTTCEREICYLALESRDVKESANKRGGSSKTIERHRTDSLKKLGAPANVKFKVYILSLFMSLCKS